METTLEFLQRLADLGVRLSLEAEQLHCFAQRGSLTQEIADGIVRHKPRIMELLRSRDESQRHAAAARSRSAPAREFPLSAGQKGLYVLQKVHPDTSAYNVPLCLRISGAINTVALERAWSHVLEQYPILTCRVVEKEEALHHCLDERCRTTIQQHAIAAADDRQVLLLLQERAKRPFDLDRGPLTRIELFIKDRQHSILLITIHHIVFDGTSAVILLKSLLTCYQQLCEGRQVEPIRQSSGYQEFVAWEEAMLASAEGKSHADYWRRQLSGELARIELRPDMPAAPVRSLAGKTLIEELPEDLGRRVQDFSKAHALPSSVIFLAAFQLLLHKYTSEDDILVGMPVMGRAAQRFADEIGYFINMVPLRVNCAARLTARQFLRKVQGTMLDALYHSSYPFPLMLDKLDAGQGEGNPVFQVSYAYQNFITHADFTALPGRQTLHLETVTEVLQEGDSDLGLEVFEGAAAFVVHWKYNHELYAENTLRRLFEHYCVLLSAMLTDPDQVMHEYPVITARERQKLLIDYNDTRADYPKDKCIHQLFGERVAIHPDKTAVVCGAQQLSYRQLHRRSCDLALYLQSQGIEPDTLVGLCVERSIDMLVGVLGIMQAGGAYLPLDSDYPDDRLTHILRDSQAAVVLVQQGLRDRVSALAMPGARIIALDQQWPQIAECAAAARAKSIEVREEVRPHHLAYVIYTSGSTGKPKGVMIEHASLVNHNSYAGRAYGITQDDVQIQFSSMSFDLFLEEIFVVLNRGATLVIEQKDRLLVPEDCEKVIRDRGVTTLNVPTAFFHQLVAADVRLDGVKNVIVGGEKLEYGKAREFVRRFPGVNLCNTYGPTETTIISAATPVSEALLDRHCDVPIGSPIANTRIYILDRRGELQPIGVPGELCIAGAGLARGYLNRPELTQEKFVADPFVAGARMYRTGDLARWLDDGNIEYLGRIDTQVKIRGFRVELGEIEAHLNQHPDIEDSIVVVRGEGADQRLVAFYRAKGAQTDHGIDPGQERLRAYLQQILPAYMLPAAFVSLATIPLTPNGKVDRRALARLDVIVKSSREYLAPRNDTERQLAQIWAQVLKLDPQSIGVRSNFFELGGHSLLATQVIAKIRSRLSIDLPLKVLFETDDLGGIAEVIATIAAQREPVSASDFGDVEFEEVSL